jgi:UDP-glucose 4-epimerase
MTAAVGEVSTQSRSRVVVTGGAGFIGSHLVRHLLADGHHVVVVDDLTGDSVAAVPQGAVPATMDCRDTDRLSRVVEGADAVVHLAASVLIRGGHLDTGQDLRRGLVSTHSVLEAARQAGVSRVCFASSSTVYGEAAGADPVDEDCPLRPISLYSASKVAGEAFVNAFSHLYGISATVLRLGIVLGAGLRRGVVFDFVNRLRADPSALTIMGDGRQRKPYVDIEDCVSAVVRLGLAPGAGVRTYNVAAEGSVSVLEVADAVLKTMGLEGIPVQGAGNEQGWPGDIPRLELSIARARAAGWTPEHSGYQAVERMARSMAGDAPT